nr:hypothetical protein Iba_chr15bCG11650 [Ipomoea batatas]
MASPQSATAAACPAKLTTAAERENGGGAMVSLIPVGLFSSSSRLRLSHHLMMAVSGGSDGGDLRSPARLQGREKAAEATRRLTDTGAITADGGGAPNGRLWPAKLLLRVSVSGANVME